MAVILDTAGAPVEDTTGAAILDTAGTPAPFASPHSAAPRHPSARRGSARGSAGAKYAYVPVVPSPFSLPHRAVKGIPGRRAGTGHGNKGTYTFSPLWQETSGSTTGTTLTLTFPKAITAGNAVILALAGYYGGAVTGVTVGGTAVTFTKVATSGYYNCEIWACYGTGQSSATVTVTTSEAGIAGWAYEVNGTVVLDQAAGANSETPATSWNSGTTAETIPYQHFAVGLAGTFGNAGTITPAASGWTGETAYAGVTGAETFGAVSGYRLPAGAGTYFYSGTSADSGGWGAVAAVFLAAPTPSSLQPGWGGYVFGEHASYTGITATFTIPTVSGGEYSSIWVGLGNVYQVGIYQTYDTSYPGNSWTRPWSFWLPGAGEDWNQAAFPTAAGDTLTLTMQLTSADWLMTIQNHTEDWTYTEVKSVLAVNIGSIQGLGAGPATWIFPAGSAEVIIEKETTELPDYGSLAFTSIATVPPASAVPAPYITVGTAIDQYPGPYNVASGSFTMYYNAES
jgi:hypothetical protein